MARIRTIKPEFPQSESMGRVSRDARLLFVMLWTIADDHGRSRSHSRMLASLLFPYDDDAGALMGTWLSELEKQDCIRLYEIDGSQYLQIMGWSKHQKIDKPSKPQFPGMDEVSEDTRESSRDTRERSSEEGKGREGTKDQGREGIKEGSSRGESSPVDLLGDSTEPPASGKRLTIPVAEVIDLYHELLPAHPRVEKINSQRRGAVQGRWRSGDLDSLDAWRNYFEDVSRSLFLTGRTKPIPPRTRPFVASFDWLINETNFTKVLEGNYQ